MITAQSNFGVSSRTFDQSDASSTAIGLAVAADVFAARSVSLGFELDASFRQTDSYLGSALMRTKSVLVGGGPRVGVNFELSERISFFPRLTLALHYRSQ